MSEEPVWLSAEEQRAWRAFLLTRQLLDEVLDRQLQRESGMPHAYYAILARLSEAVGGALRMSELARSLWYSQSRLTHAVTALERDGWVRREQCPTDRRGQIAVLTEKGLRALTAAAPGHVAEVRARLFDNLSAEQVGQLADICERLLPRLEAGLSSPTSPPSEDDPYDAANERC